ncbi:MAG TPA: histidine triad nucleotide-binding protein [Geobacteraceae bacterium]|nr:histidine triad nucleotide-binding protein [Geobacteraceae bacterium]
MERCVFCQIIADEIPSRKVYEDEHLIVIEDISPVAPLHVLIIPRRHIVNSLDLEEEDSFVVGHAFKVAAKIARKNGLADDGFRIVNNNNVGAGQSVFHLHFHLLAGRKFSWPPG